jgi:predicted transposase YbfD/YdcC
MVCHNKKMAIRATQSNQNFFQESFSTLQDPRRTTKGNLIYSLEEILFLTISAVICGCNSWASIAEYGRLKKDWFRKFYCYKKMPSHDAIGDLFCMLDAKKFSECFISWVNGIATKEDSGVVAIDGKTVRGAASKGSKFPLHIVSAFCAKNRLCLGQRSTDEKSNEITAIPQLLDLLTLGGCIVTIDATGCQRDIAEKVRGQKADYIFQVKDNQKNLKEQMQDIFESKAARKTDEAAGSGHGRIEKRRCEAIPVKEVLLEGFENWKDLQTVVRIRSERTIKKTGEKSIEHRYYISSLPDDPKLLNSSIRSHWGIENNLHWNLDVLFGEDGQLKRKGNSAENFNVIAKVALGLVDNEKTQKISKPLKRLRASIDDSYREMIMKI